MSARRGRRRGGPFLGSTVLAIALSTPAFALERVSKLADLPDGPWVAQGSCNIVYYNVCTGWIWTWSRWAEGDRFGVRWDACCPNAEVTSTRFYGFAGIPPGWGYTGSLVELLGVDSQGCPAGPPLAAQPLRVDDGWSTQHWHVPVPEHFAMRVTLRGHWLTWLYFATDYPGAGPSGPPACGTCYPSSRTTHSFRWHTVTPFGCPGEPFRRPGDPCDAELVWSVQLHCPVHAEDSPWGAVKNLYR